MRNTTTILGGRVIRNFILGVERSQKLFRRQEERQKLDVRILEFVCVYYESRKCEVKIRLWMRVRAMRD